MAKRCFAVTAISGVILGKSKTHQSFVRRWEQEELRALLESVFFCRGWIQMNADISDVVTGLDLQINHEEKKVHGAGTVGH